MAKTINLKQLNGDWIVNNAVGTERIWTRGIYSIVYSDNIFNTGTRGWIVKQTDGVEIFAFKTDGDPWSSERTIIWNPNASGYTEDSTANLNVKTIENDYLVDGAGTNSYNGLYQYKADLSFNGKNVYVDENNYLFYSALLSKWVISNSLNDNGIFAYSGNLDDTWQIQEEGVSPAPSVIKYLPYMNVKSENIKTGVHVGDVEGQFTSDATATASHIMKGQSAYVKGKKIQGSIEESTPSTIDNEVTIPTGIISEQKKITVGTKLQSRSYKPSNQEQVIISSNTYITGNQIIEGDANLISENIKKGVSIFGVNGSLQQIENDGSVQSTKLLFRLPWIDNEEYYHLFIEFSESNDFSNVEVFNTKDNIEMFKIFTGLGIVDLPTTGINYLFSEKILQLNIADIGSSYKYFRFHWTNDEGETFGEYDYGNRESAVQVYGNKQATKLLFRLPQIGNEEYYHLSIQFSESDDFSNVEVFNTKDNMEMFKVFTGLGIVDLPTVYDEQQQKYVSAGINYLFSEKILCMDIRDVEYSYKNFRFHWSNDDCETFGEYDYGNVNANMSGLCGGAGNTEDDSIDIPLLLMHFNDNLDIQGKLSTSVAFGYEQMWGGTNTYTPSYEEGMFGRKCLYIKPPTQEEIDYGEAWNKYIELPITNYFIDNDYTLDFWFKLVEGFNISVCNNLINISNSRIQCNISDGISTKSFQYNSTIDNTWHHIALVKFSGIYYLYLDGVKISTYNEWDTKHQNIVYMKIGSTDSITAGYVDELRITKKALWTENFTPPQVETIEYDKKEEHIVLVDAPFIDSLQVNPECTIAGDSLSMGERGGMPCAVDSRGASYMRKNWFQPTRKYYTSLWFWSDKDTADYIMDFSYCRLIVNSGGVVTIWGQDKTSVDSSAGAFLPNAWNHVLWQYDATTRTVWLYVNGKFEASVANRHNSVNGNLVIFGGLQGGIRNLQIVSGLLTDIEIENIYNKGV